MARPRDRPGGRAFRCTWDKKNYVGIKAAVLFTKGLHCMHWHARVARSVVLALTASTTETLTSAFPTIRVTGRAAGTHIGSSRTSRRAQRLAWASKKLRWRRGRPTPGAAGPAPDLQLQPPGSTHFCKQKVGVDILAYYWVYI